MAGLRHSSMVGLHFRQLDRAKKTRVVLLGAIIGPHGWVGQQTNGCASTALKRAKSPKKLLPRIGQTINMITLIARLNGCHSLSTLGKVQGMVLIGRVNSAAA
jgi:hypothetical protein